MRKKQNKECMKIWNISLSLSLSLSLNLSIPKCSLSLSLPHYLSIYLSQSVHSLCLLPLSIYLSIYHKGFTLSLSLPPLSIYLSIYTSRCKSAFILYFIKMPIKWEKKDCVKTSINERRKLSCVKYMVCFLINWSLISNKTFHIYFFALGQI